MSITFRDRKHGRIMDSMFFVEASADRNWRVGDGVAIMFEIAADLLRSLRTAVAELAPPQDGLYPHEKCVTVRCRVVSICHSLSWASVGNLSDLGGSAVLEPVDGYHEDVLRMVLFGTIPEWMSKDGGT